MSEENKTVNRHRGDTVITVDDQDYTLCYDLNACTKVMDHLGLKTFEDMTKEENMSDLGLSDILNLIWIGFLRHYPDMTRDQVGAMDWDLEELTDKFALALQRALVKERDNKVEDQSPEGGEERDPQAA